MQLEKYIAFLIQKYIFIVAPMRVIFKNNILLYVNIMSITL